MANFSYTARNPQDQIVKGTVSAASREAAMQTVIKQGLKPILLKKRALAASTGKKLLSFGGGKVKSHDLVIFTRQLSTMVSAGVPLVGALDTLKNQPKAKNLKSSLQAWLRTCKAA
jgi:type IV pilus assembly protein PilC